MYTEPQFCEASLVCLKVYCEIRELKRHSDTNLKNVNCDSAGCDPKEFQTKKSECSAVYSSHGFSASRGFSQSTCLETRFGLGYFLLAQK